MASFVHGRSVLALFLKPENSDLMQYPCRNEMVERGLLFGSARTIWAGRSESV